MKIARLLHDTGGTAAIEFAIISSVYIMLLFGIIEGGYALYYQLGVQHGAEMAARCASVNSTTCGSTSAIKTYASGQSYGLSPPVSVFTVSTPSCGNKVDASYTYSFLGNFWGVMTVTLTGSSCFPK